METRFRTIWSYQPQAALNESKELLNQINRAIAALERVEKKLLMMPQKKQ